MNISIEISIIVCTFNHEKWIERCVRSILNQENIDKEKLEVIIVNDKSKDQTSEILKKYKNFKNMKVIENKKNIGLPKSINKAIKLSSGRYLMRVDSDDYIHRNCVFFMKFYLDFNRHYQAVSCDYVKVNKNEEYLKRYNSIKNQIACGILFRRECLFDLGLYDEKFKMREGHDLRNRFLKKYKLGHLELPLYKYRDHDSNRTKNKVVLARYNNKLIKKT